MDGSGVAGSGAAGRRSVGVVGLGLVGGSLARRLAPAYDVVGYDADPATRRDAAAAGLAVVESTVDAVAGRDLVALAVPLQSFGDLLPAIAAAVRTDAIVTDVTSVKGAPLAAARSAATPGAGRLRWVGGHPMAGTERSGFAAGDARLFDGVAWVLCVEDDTDLAAWLEVASLVTGLGCRVVPCSAEAHDAAVARVSGLPHLLASVLAESAGEAGPLALSLASGSFRDGTRVAATRPDLVAALCDGNREALAVAADEAIRRLAEARDALRAGGSVRRLATAGHAARRAWTAAGVGGRESTVDISVPGLRDRLRWLGMSGGHVRAVRPGVLDIWMPAGER